MTIFNRMIDFRWIFTPIVIVITINISINMKIVNSEDTYFYLNLKSTYPLIYNKVKHIYIFGIRIARIQIK